MSGQEAPPTPTTNDCVEMLGTLINQRTALLQAKLDKANETIENLSARLHLSENRRSCNGDEQLNNACMIIENRDTQIIDLKRQLHDAITERNAISMKLGTERDNARAIIVDRDIEITDLKRKFVAMRDERESLACALGARESHAARVTELEAKVKQWEDWANEHNVIRAVLEKRCDKMCIERNDARNERDQAQRCVNNLETIIAEHESMHKHMQEQLVGVMAERDAMQRTNEELQASNKAMNERYLQRCQQATDRKEQLTAAFDKIVKLETELWTWKNIKPNERTDRALEQLNDAIRARDLARDELREVARERDLARDECMEARRHAITCPQAKTGTSDAQHSISATYPVMFHGTQVLININITY